MPKDARLVGGRAPRQAMDFVLFAALVEGRQHVPPDEPARTGNQYPLSTRVVPET